MVLRHIVLFALPLSFCVATAAQSTSPSKPTDGANPDKRINRRVATPPEKAKPIRVPHFDKPPVIDGKLDDEVWKQAVACAHRLRHIGFRGARAVLVRMDA